MFALSCASLALAQRVISQVTIPIEHRRPSKLMELFQSNGQRAIAPMAIIEPDDAAGTLIVKGSANDIGEIRKIVALVDIPRQRAEISIDVLAPTDRIHYVQTVELYGGESWSSKDNDLGLTISIVAGSQLGRTVTLSVNSGDGRHRAQSKFRLALGQSASQPLGKTFVMSPSPGVGGEEESPIITFKFLGLHGE